jgi:hypothetical protein
MSPRPLIGDLAQMLIDSDGGLMATEQIVVDVVTELLPGWRGGWIWLKPRGIAIYDAIDSPAAAAALHLAGFTGGVVIHGHDARRFLTCECVRRMPGFQP